MKRPPYLSIVQGASEAQTEAYLTYVEGALQLATQEYAKSQGGVGDFAGEQALAVRSSG